ncbi:uncharacterized protein PG986_003987 [Apiospora aurea]|uniref:FAD-binding PCMH-type domain-containing protein n=1 Tax=Apiospora aurea TaxID=335848 RepID=A0ABR1QLA7_9PEZI
MSPVDLAGGETNEKCSLDCCTAPPVGRTVEKGTPSPENKRGGPNSRVCVSSLPLPVAFPHALDKFFAASPESIHLHPAKQRKDEVFEIDPCRGLGGGGSRFPASGLPNSACGCCAKLEKAGLANVLKPGSETYENRTKTYWSITSQLTPWCIGVVEDGVTIDLGLIDGTVYDAENKVARISPGSRWGGVYGALEPHGMTVPGGRASTVGVAGFLNGGGNSFYSARKGFACDNVVNFEVVLANGTIIDANASDNSDLYQAMKGGQSNFGIVTRFDMQAFEAPKLWGGVVQWNKTATEAAIDAHVAWVDAHNDNLNDSAIIFWSYQPALKDTIIITSLVDTEGHDSPAGLSPFLGMAPKESQLANTIRTATHKELTDELEQPAGYRDIWWTGTIKNDRRVYEKVLELHDELCAFMAAQSPDGDFVTQAMFQSIPTIFSQHSEERGGNVLGLDREPDNVIMLLFTLAVNGADQERVAREQMRKWSDGVMAFAQSVDAAVQWQYVNYAYEYQDPLTSYGEANVAKIVDAAAKYDPAGVFQTRSPMGFKISNRSGYGWR